RRHTRFSRDWSSECALPIFEVNTIVADGERTIAKMAEHLQDRGIVLNAATAAQHAPVIEVRIRVIKERSRAILSSLPYILPSRRSEERRVGKEWRSRRSPGQ